MNFDERRSLPYAASIIAGMSGFFTLSVPVIVIFFCSNNSAVGTDVKKYP
jgi:hypothetical protein